MNETLVKYVDIDLQLINITNPDLNITDEEGRYLNKTMSVILL